MIEETVIEKMVDKYDSSVDSEELIRQIAATSDSVDSDDLMRQASALLQGSQDEEIPAVLTEEYPAVQSLPSIAEDGSRSEENEGSITQAVQSKHTKKSSPLVPLVLFLAVFGMAAAVGISLGLEKRDESTSNTESNTSYLRPKANTTTDTVKDVEKIGEELEVSPSEYAAGLLEALEEEKKAIDETTGPKSSNSANPEPPPPIVDEDVEANDMVAMSMPINIVSHELTMDEEEVINYTVDEEEKTSIDSLIAMSIPANIVPYGDDGPQFGRRRYN